MPPDTMQAGQDDYFDKYSSAPAVAAQPAQPQDHADAQPVEVISPSEAKKRQDSGGYLANGQQAPQAAVIDTQQPGPAVPNQPPDKSQVAAENDDYFEKQYGKPEELPVKPTALKPPKKTLGDRAWSLTQGALGQSNRLAQLLAMAGETATSLTQKITTGMGYGAPDANGDLHNKTADALAKTYAENVTQPLDEHQQNFDLGPNADFTDKALHGVGSTLMFIDQMIATGGEAAPGEIAATLPGRVAQGLESGASMAQVPAVANAIAVGKQVLKQTGSQDAATTAAVTSYTTTIATAGLPMAFGKGIATRVATAAAAGPVLGEVQRQVNNAALGPEKTDAEGRNMSDEERNVYNKSQAMKTPFSLEESAIEALTSAPFGFLPGHAGQQIPRTPDVRPAVEGHEDIIDHAQSVAAAEVARQGGDLLDQTVAATHVTAVVGAHFHAAEYEGNMEVRNQQVAQEAEIQRQAEEQQAREVALNEAAEAKKTNATPLSDAFAEAEQNTAEGKAKDYSSALNQKGDQEVERGDTLSAGAEKGGEGFEQPKLLDSLDPDQLKAFKTLAERRTAEMAGEPLPDESPESKFTPYVEPVSRKIVAEPDKVQNTVQTEPAKAPETLQAWRASAGLEPVDMTQPQDVRAVEREGVAALRDREEAEAAPATTGADVDAAAQESAYSPESDKPVPTQAQYKAGNYQKGHVDVQGMDISVEHPNGSERPLGNTGESRTMGAHYGYIKGTVGADGQHVDAMVGKHPENQTAFVVDHLNESGEFEQHKVLLGFQNKLAAMRAYRSAYPDRPLGPVSETSTAHLKDWLANSDTTKPFDAKGVNRLADTRPSFADSGARAQPADVKHVVEGRSHVATTANGETRARRDGNGNLRIISTHTEPEARGSGEGTARLERLAQEAHKTGNKLVSDNEVSEPEQRVYKSLADRGYDVKENPNTVDPGTGVKKSASELKGVYEVGPKPEPAQARDTSPPRSAEEADIQRAAPLSKDEAQRTLKPVLDKRGDNVQVHDDATTLPQHIKDQMAANNHPDPRGVYDPTTDQVHIVAGSHETHDQLVRTAVHEIVGHQGLRHLLGDDFAAKMANIYQSIKGGSWVKDYMSQHGLDSRNQRHQRLAADEYVAHLAERDVGDPEQENPGILRKAIDAVRAGLRKVGLVRDWTDNDLRQLIRKSANNLAAENTGIRESAQAKGDGPRFADKEDNVPFDNDHPLSQAHKFGKTMEEQANYNPGFLKSRADWLKDKIGNTIDSRMAFIGLRNLPDFMDGKLMPSLRQFIRTHDQMDGRRGDLMNKAADLAKDWSRYTSKDKARGAALGELMHASTLGGVDPSKPFETRYTDAEKTADATKAAHEDMRKDLHARLKEVFNKQLDDKGRELFNTVRDRYAQNRAEVLKALQARIDASGADNNTKQAVMGELRKKFESGKLQGPYFPLARFGDHWASAKDKQGNTVSFSRFESASQKKAWIGEMKDKGFDTDGGQRMDDKSMMERIDPQFVQKVTEMAKQVDPHLADEIWQTYLKAMPEMSMRKHLIHRVGRLGYSMDAMRAFAYNSFHGAHQLARLEYGNRLDTALDNIKAEARTVESADPTSKNAQWAPALAREMSRRYDWIKNPRSSPLASALTKFGFGWYLGAAPATAFRIFSQNPMLAQPMLAKFHGQIGATRELSRASAQWAMARGSLGDTLRGDERRAFDTANERGMFSSTATQNLASGGSGEPMFTGTYYHVQKALGYMFNGMEHHNRQTTYMAAYRLAKMQGVDHDAAVDHAGDLTWDSHFDYTNANRPRVLQNDFAKVALLFKQYSWGVTYRLAREARDMFNSELSPEENVQARKAFAGLMTRGMLFAGVTGMPLHWIATSVINAIMGDKDRPFDADAAMHKSLADHIGQTAADAVMTGPMGAVTGASLSNGASYNDLWYRPPSRDEKPTEQWSDLTGQMLGAIPAIGTNAITGAQMIGDGQTERGLEHFVPPEMSALMKAYRYNKEGVTNLKGEPVLTRDELDNKDLFLQAIGFTPQKVADAYARNTALKNISEAVQQRREAIINHVTVASGMNDSAEIDSAMADVEHFNETNPGLAINGKGLISSMRNRYKGAAESVNGVKLPPGLSELRDQY